MNTEIDFGKVLSRIGYLYIALPFLIFLIGWCRWYIFIPGILIILFCLIQLFRKSSLSWKVRADKRMLFYILGIAFIILVWLFFSGIGKFSYQNSDHYIRNQIFEILVRYDWPATTQFGGDRLGIVYYIGFWLPAALFGKVFGMHAGFVFQFIWAFIGVFLVYGCICMYRRKLVLWPLFLFIAFSGMDIVGKLLLSGDLHELITVSHIEGWAEKFQFSSNTTQLYWVFNQCIAAWLILILMILQKNNRFRIFLCALALISCPLPFFGMIPVLIYYMFHSHYDNKRKKMDFKSFFRDTFSPENLIGGGFTGILTFLYIRENRSSQIVGDTLFAGVSIRRLILLYLLFLLLEAVLFFAVIYKYNKKNPLFYVILIWLVLCPFIVVGFGADFCMRASIPALFVLYLFMVDALTRAEKEKRRWMLVLLLLLLAIGAVTPMREFIRSVKNTPEEHTTVPEKDVWDGYNFTGYTDDSLFFTYIAKRGRS